MFGSPINAVYYRKHAAVRAHHGVSGFPGTATGLSRDGKASICYLIHSCLRIYLLTCSRFDAKNSVFLAIF
jgi:hypothetical protein